MGKMRSKGVGYVYENLITKCIVMYNNNKNTPNCDMRVIQERSWEDDVVLKRGCLEGVYSGQIAI